MNAHDTTELKVFGHIHYMKQHSVCYGDDNENEALYLCIYLYGYIWIYGSLYPIEKCAVRTDAC